MNEVKKTDINYLINKVFYRCGHLDLTYEFKWRLVLNLKADENSRARSHSIWLMFEDAKAKHNRFNEEATASIHRSVGGDLR